MARLVSEDQEVVSAIDLELGAPFEESGTWLSYRLALRSGHRMAVLQDDDEGSAGPGAGVPVGRCALGQAPRDEVQKLIDGLQALLDGKRQSLKFEPQEPNWSLEIAAGPEGWTVVCWLDAGNQLTCHYTWDAMGIRFFTDSTRIRAFAEALEAERAVS
jgi:hypothetical protein